MWFQVIFTAIMFAAAYYQQENYKREMREQSRKGRGTHVTKMGADEHLPVFYGKCLNQGGTIVFMQSSDVVDDDPTVNDFLHLVIVWGESVSSIDDMYIDGVNINSSKFVDNDGQWAHYWHYPAGLQNRYHPELEALGFDRDHQLEDCAVSVVRLQWEKTGRIFQGRPNITVDVTGKKVYNPITDDETYTTNPALQLLDYLTNAQYGKGLKAHEVDIQSFTRAAKQCDLLVETYQGSGEYEPLFESNYRLETSEPVKSNVGNLLESMRGFLPIVDGKLHLIVDDLAPEVDYHLCADNIISGTLKHQASQKNNKFNRVTIQYQDETARGNINEVTYPATNSDIYRTWLAQDNAVKHEKTFHLKSCSAKYLARRHAEVIAKLSRESLCVELRATPDAAVLMVGDVVPVTHEISGWDKKPFRVLSVSTSHDGNIKLKLREHQAYVYHWNIDAPLDATPDTQLPEPWVCETPTHMQAKTQPDGAIGIVWQSIYQAFEVEIIKDGKTLKTESVLIPEYHINDFGLGDYTCRVRALNRVGYFSNWAVIEFTVTQPGIPTIAVDSHSFDSVTLSAALPGAGFGTAFEFQFLGSNETPVDVPALRGYTYTREGLLPDTTYNFRVRTINPIGQSDWVMFAHTTDDVNTVKDLITGLVDFSEINRTLNEKTRLVNDNQSAITQLQSTTKTQAQTIEQVALKADETAESFGAVTQAFEVVKDEVGAIQSQYTIKTDAKGVVAGIGLISDEDAGVSKVAIMADQFAIMPPGYTPQSPALYPFSYNNEEGKVFINSVMINDADVLDLVADKLTGEHIQAGSTLKSPRIQAGEMHATQLYSAHLHAPVIDIRSDDYTVHFDAQSRYPVWFGTGRVGGSGAQFYIDARTNKAVFKGELGAQMIDWRNMREDGLYETQYASLDEGNIHRTEVVSLPPHVSRGNRIDIEIAVDIQLPGQLHGGRPTPGKDDTPYYQIYPKLKVQIQVADTNYQSGWQTISTDWIGGNEELGGTTIRGSHGAVFNEAISGEQYHFRALLGDRSDGGAAGQTTKYLVQLQSSESFIKSSRRLFTPKSIAGVTIAPSWGGIQNKPDLLTLSETPGSDRKCFGKEEQELHTPPLGLLPFDGESCLGDDLHPFQQVHTQAVDLGLTTLTNSPSHPGLQVKTPYGIGTMGAIDETAQHFLTDRPKFHLNQRLEAKRSVGSTQGDFVLTRAGVEKVSVKENKVESINPVSAPWLEEGGIPIDAKYLSLSDFEAGDATVNRVAIGAIADFIKNATDTQDGQYTLKKAAIRSGFINSNMIAAGTITTKNLSVTARSLINNFSISQSSEGWTNAARIEKEVPYQGKKVTALKVPYDAQNTPIQSERFDIDHGSIYEVTITMFTDSLAQVSGAVFLQAYADKAQQNEKRHVNINVLHQNHLDKPLSKQSWAIITSEKDVGHTGFYTKTHRTYIVGAQVDPSNAPLPENTPFIVQLSPDTKSIHIDLRTHQNQGGELYWFSPSVKATSGGHIVARSIDVGKVFSDEANVHILKSKLGVFNDVEAENIRLNYQGDNQVRFSAQGNISIPGITSVSAFGAIGTGDSNTGSKTGLAGRAYQGYGLLGYSKYNDGVRGISEYNDGVKGSTTDADSAGVYGGVSGDGGWGGVFECGKYGNLLLHLDGYNWPTHYARMGTIASRVYRDKATLFLKVRSGRGRSTWERIVTSSS